jgi:hypothetical protein
MEKSIFRVCRLFLSWSDDHEVETKYIRGDTVIEKLKNWLNWENWKKIIKKLNHEKNRLKFWNNRPVRFRFYKSETEKTEPKQKKLEKTEPNWFEPVLS